MKNFLKTTAIAAICSVLVTANAANVNLSKLRLYVGPQTPNESLNVINPNKEESSSVQVELKKWTQKQNADNTLEDVLEDTETIIISPRTTVIPPDSMKNIRVLVDDDEVAEKEHSYRLIVQELPKDKKNTENSITVLFKFSIPVFYVDENKKIENMNVTSSLITEGDQKYFLIENKDTQHIQILNVLNAEQSAKFENDKSLSFEGNIQPAYLLPGVKNKFLIKGDGDFSTYTLTTDKGSKKIVNNK